MKIVQIVWVIAKVGILFSVNFTVGCEFVLDERKEYVSDVCRNFCIIRPE